MSLSFLGNEHCGFPLRHSLVNDLRDLDGGAAVATVTLCGHVGVVLRVTKLVTCLFE